MYQVNHAELDKRFTHHPPKYGSEIDSSGAVDTVIDQCTRYVALRDHAKVFAREIMRLTPASREQSLALTNIEQVVMWAHAAIARHE